MLQLDHIEIIQGDFRLSADWSLQAGERLAVIGPSGAGKSTLLAAISGFYPPARGRVLWQGQDLGPLPPGKRPLSILFQDQNLFPHLTLTQNLRLGLEASGTVPKQAGDAIEAALREVGLADMGKRRPSELSGGQISRAALARVLLMARPLLLLDEPFAALGPALRHEMLDLVAKVASRTGASVIMVTHDPGDAARLCPLTTLVAEGLAHPPRPTAALLADPPPALAAYLG